MEGADQGKLHYQAMVYTVAISSNFSSNLFFMEMLDEQS